MYATAIGWLSGWANKAELLRQTGAKKATFYKVLQGKNTSAEEFMRWLDHLGWRLTPPGDLSDTSRPVQFVKLLPSSGTGHLPAPDADKYRAIPLVQGEVAAGEGLLPEEGLESWVLIYMNDPAVSQRSNLIAVRVGKKQNSMLPLIWPGDMLLVDREDKVVQEGRIYLVRDPEEGAAIKRVKVFERKGKMSVTFYSENVPEHPPATYEVDQFKGGLAGAIVGRCVWQWSDLSRK